MAEKKATTAKKNETAADKGHKDEKATAKTADKPAAKNGGAKAAATASKEKSISDLISVIADKTGLPKNKTKELLEAHAEILIDELKTAGSVQLVGVGKLKLGERAERQGRNPATGEAITIKASKQVKFAGAKRFKDSFNG